jgi:hypothetical protein
MKRQGRRGKHLKIGAGKTFFVLLRKRDHFHGKESDRIAFALCDAAGTYCRFLSVSCRLGFSRVFWKKTMTEWLALPERAAKKQKKSSLFLRSFLLHASFGRM